MAKLLKSFEAVAVDVRFSPNNPKHKPKLPRRRNKSFVSEFEHEREDAPNAVKPSSGTPVFLYMKMVGIGVQTQSDNVDVNVAHPSSVITKISDPNDQPVFAMKFEQDNIEDLNKCSDAPLQITLFRKQLLGTGSPDDDNLTENLKPIGLGSVDLLQFFSNDLNPPEVDIYIYPIKKPGEPPGVTYLTKWKFQTKLPLAKNLSFCNIAYINFESIYKAKPEIMADWKNLMVNLSFESVIFENLHYNKLKFCSFKCFDRNIIIEQNIYLKWESMINEEGDNLYDLGVRTGCEVDTYLLFQNLLCTDGGKIDFNDINKYEDEALVCNAVHRFVLTKEMVAILEDVVAFNEQRILVELFTVDEPDVPLLQGYIDLSIFMYPEVQECRFAVELKPRDHGPSKQVSAISLRAKKKGKSTLKLPAANATNSPTAFAIIGISVYAPITNVPKTINTQKHSENLFRCATKEDDQIVKGKHEIQDPYKSFDNLINTIISEIGTKKIKNQEEGQNFLKSHMKNFNSILTKLIACDFSSQFPTKTNIEFTHLITTVYKRLENRISDILNDDHVPQPDGEDLTSKQGIILVTMKDIKLLYELGDKTMAEFLYGKLLQYFPQSNDLNFFILLQGMETKDYAALLKYKKLPLKEKDLNYQYYIEWFDIYTEYISTLYNEQNFNEAFTYLLNALNNFLKKHPKNVYAWVLMYCIYKKCNYQPGMAYARWKYEHLFNAPLEVLPALPHSRWQLYSTCSPNFQNEKEKRFFKVMQAFHKLGLYKFAEFVYLQFASECNAVENYLLTTSFKIIQDEVNEEVIVKNLPVEKVPNANELKAHQAFTSGNLEYYRGNINAAMKNYARILDIPGIESYENYLLGLLRYGEYMYMVDNYTEALRTYAKCCKSKDRLIAHIGMGKALYKLDRLKEAEKCFAATTTHEIHLPDTWAYLALINLKLGDNYKALECWQYAKLDPNNVISAGILEELEKVNISKVSLNVNVPLSKTPIQSPVQSEEVSDNEDEPQ